MAVHIQGCNSLRACTPLSQSNKKGKQNEVQTIVTLLKIQIRGQSM